MIRLRPGPIAQQPGRGRLSVITDGQDQRVKGSNLPKETGSRPNDSGAAFAVRVMPPARLCRDRFMEFSQSFNSNRQFRFFARSELREGRSLDFARTTTAGTAVRVALERGLIGNE